MAGLLASEALIHAASSCMSFGTSRGLGRHVDNAAASAVTDHVLAIAVGRWFGGLAPTGHHQGVEEPGCVIPSPRCGGGDRFGFRQGGKVAEHFLLIALAAGEVLVLANHFANLLLRQPITLDHRRVMGRNRREVARKVASTEGVIGKSSTACRAASIRIRLRAMFAVIVNVGLNGISAVCRQWRLPLLCR